MCELAFLQERLPITNLPDLLDVHIDNFLGIPWLAQLIFIFVVIAVMEFFNYKIRHCGKSQYYPILYSLLAVSLLSIYYYCFQNGLPEVAMIKYLVAKPCIGWFCYHSQVGWVLAILGILALIFVIYVLLTAIMQTLAQMSVDGGMIEGKPWKEYKVGLFLAFAGIVVCGLTYFIGAIPNAWALLIFAIVITLFVLIKIIMDIVRYKKVCWAIAVGLVFYIGILAAIMLSVECMRGASIVFVALLALFSRAKASKKQPKKVE